MEDDAGAAAAAAGGADEDGDEGRLLRLRTPPPAELSQQEDIDVPAGGGHTATAMMQPAHSASLSLASPMLQPLRSPALSATRHTAPGSGSGRMSLGLDDMGSFALDGGSAGEDAAASSSGTAALQSPMLMGASPASAGGSSSILPQLPHHHALAQLTSPPLAPLARSTAAERPGRPRDAVDVDDDEAGATVAAAAPSSGSSRPSKKQRRASTHPPPPSMSPSSASAATAAHPASHALEDDPADQDEDSFDSSVGESGDEDEEEEGEDDDDDEEDASVDDGDAPALGDRNLSTPQQSSLPRIASSEQLLTDPPGGEGSSPTDDGLVANGGSMFASLPEHEGEGGSGLFALGVEDLTNGSGGGSQNGGGGIIDLTDEDLPLLTTSAASQGHSIYSPHGYQAAPSASPAPLAAGAAAPHAPTSFGRQSITSSLFGGGGGGGGGGGASSRSGAGAGGVGAPAVPGGLLPASNFSAYPAGTVPHPPSGGSAAAKNAAAAAAAAAAPAASPVASPSNTVDLQGNSDEDEASDNKLGTILCLVYGMRLCPGTAAVGESVKLVRIHNSADKNALRVDNIIDQPCGVLNKDTAAALAPLIDFRSVRVQARVGTLTEAEMGLRIDIYGKSSDRSKIERTIAKFPMVKYMSLHNPQAAASLGGEGGGASAAGLNAFLQEHGGADASATAAAAAAAGQGMSVREIENDLDCLFGAEIDLALMPLAETPVSLRTHLHPYQRQGLAWMLQHEEQRVMNVDSGKNELLFGWQKITSPSTGKVAYYNKLTKEMANEAPRMACGGLLADEMGLGKTLQVLSLVATSLTKGVSSDGVSNKLKFKRSSTGASSTFGSRPNAPTLIVCPLSVITNWEQQVLHHFHPSHLLSYYTYHGPGRCRDVSVLRGYDLIITTYNILAQEFDASQAALGLDPDAPHDDDSDDDDDPFKSLQKKRKTKSSSSANANKPKKAQTAGAMAAAAALAAAAEADPEAAAAAGRPKAAPLFEIDFFRIILDEAQQIRERRTLQSRAARALSGERRWALSGTPLVNKVDDAFALLNFIRVPPFTSHAMWQRLIARPLKARDPKGMQRLQQVFSSVCLRRKKNEEINGKRILLLPDKTQRIRHIQLSGKEKALYDTLSESGRQQFNKLLQSDSVLRHYAYVLEILLRMRQACNHSMLVPSHYHQHGFSALAETKDKQAELHRLVALLEESVADECGMCRKLADDPVITQCCHFFCRKCIDSYLEQPAYHNAVYEAQFLPPGTQPQPNATLFCPQCRLQLDKALIIGMHHRELLRLEEEQKQAAALHARGHVTLSPKLLALLEELQLVLNKGDKAIVFSQWTSFLNILQACLQQANVRHVRLDGQMSAANRAKALKAFEDDDSVKVFLISLKAGGQYEARNKRKSQMQFAQGTRADRLNSSLLFVFVLFSLCIRCRSELDERQPRVPAGSLVESRYGRPSHRSRSPFGADETRGSRALHLHEQRRRKDSRIAEQQARDDHHGIVETHALARRPAAGTIAGTHVALHITDGTTATATGGSSGQCGTTTATSAAATTAATTIPAAAADSRADANVMHLSLGNARSCESFNQFSSSSHCSKTFRFPEEKARWGQASTASAHQSVALRCCAM
jgi:SNF2 family DNA or RNA helicase